MTIATIQSVPAVSPRCDEDNSNVHYNAANKKAVPDILRQLAAARRRVKLTQKQIAKKMGTTA